jgi:hypothetical protein
MQATLSLHPTARNSKKTSAITPAVESASVEIHSYLAARDLLLRAADVNTNEANLRCAWAANEFAESCLRPARAPYHAQVLPEAEAACERRRCTSVRLRLAELRVRSGLRVRAA